MIVISSSRGPQNTPPHPTTTTKTNLISIPAYYTALTWLSRPLTAAPSDSKYPAASVAPFSAAQCSGLRPAASALLTEAPKLTRVCATSKYCCEAIALRHASRRFFLVDALSGGGWLRVQT